MALKPGNGGTGGNERDPRLDGLYRDASRETPPPHLDAAILPAARREVGARPRPLSALRRWRVPVSIAAVVVLSVSLVTLVREEGGEALLHDDRLSATSSTARQESPRQQPAEPARAPEAGERSAAAPAVRERAARAPEELSLRRDEAAALAAAEARRPREGESARSSAEPAPRASAPAGPDPAASPAVPLAGALSYQLQDAPARAEADSVQKLAPAIAAQGMFAETEPPAAAPRPPASAPQARPKPLAEGKARVEDRLRAEAKRAPRAWQGLEREPPQKWLERLAELRKQGRTREADELLAEFKRRFPEHPLPVATE